MQPRRNMQCCRFLENEMSNWTDILIGASMLEDEGPEDGPPSFPAIDFLNERLGVFPLFLIENPGPKGQAPHCCFAGSSKNIGWDDFKAAVDAAPWRWREQVQVFMRQEDDAGFVVYRPSTSTQQ